MPAPNSHFSALFTYIVVPLYVFLDSVYLSWVINHHTIMKPKEMHLHSPPSYELCVSPTFISWILNPQCDDIWRWRLWDVIGSWNRTLMMGDERPFFTYFWYVRTQQRGIHLQTRNPIIQHLDVELLSF